MCPADLSSRMGPTSNHRLDPSHSGVTALAQGRKRRAGCLARVRRALCRLERCDRGFTGQTVF